MALKKASALMNLGGVVTLTDGGGFTQSRVNLPLDALNREVFVVTDIQLDYNPGLLFDAAVGGTQEIAGQISMNTQVAMLGINDPDIIGRFGARTLQGGVANPGAGTSLYHANPDETSSGTQLDHLSIVATPDFFVGGIFATTTGGGPARSINIRLTGYRGIADVGTYSALIAQQING
jgi:hypothetical protein